MGRRTDLSVIRPPKVNREPYVWFRTKDLNFRGTNPLSCVRAPGGWFMAPSRAAAYPHHAQECLRLADLMTSPEHRAELVSMARVWHRLAQLHDTAEQRETIAIEC